MENWFRKRAALNLGPSESQIWLSWLVRLRWLAVFAQVVTLGFVFNVLASPLTIVIWVSVVVILLLANLWASRTLNQQRPVGNRELWFHLALDVVALTTYFYLGGGQNNPFVSLYFVHVAMAAVMLTPRLAVALMVLVFGCYTGLFFFHIPLRYEGHSLPMDILVPLGQGVSFLLTICSVTFFVVSIASALRRRKEQLLNARDKAARIDRLNALGTLAAGAAHELNTPLSTLDLRLRRVGRRHPDADTASDLRVARTQVERCTSIVERLLYGAGDPMASDIETAKLASMCQQTIRLWQKSSSILVEIQGANDEVEVELPQVAFQQALTNLLENARQAQEQIQSNVAIKLRIYSDGPDAVVDLIDHGCGLPDGEDQVGEPFFTTKGTGTGLGVFVARALAEGVGGGLRYIPRKDGTTARWWFPKAARRAG